MIHEPISILMLEDSVLDADLATARLTRAGLTFTATRVDTRAAFESALLQGRYDVVLSDYALPDFDGLSALDFALRHAPGTPFIIVSGVMGEEHAIEALKRGTADYVLKPRLDKLAPAVERAIVASRTAARNREAEEELRRTQELSRRVFESTRDCIMTIDPTGIIQSVNASAAAWFGMTGSGSLWFNLWQPSDRPAAEAAFKQALAGGAQSFEASGAGSGEEVRCWNVLVTPVCDATGRTELVLSVARDNTDRRRREEERLLLLAREKQARADAEEKAKQLQQSFDDLEHFASVVSHDLREPLRVVTMYSQLLSRRFPEVVDNQSREYLSHIENGTRRMASLLSDLLSYSRVVHEDQDFDIVSIGLIIEEALRNVSLAIEESGATVETGPMPQVRGHRAQLVQLFQNLVGNALKYRSSVPPHISIGCEMQGGQWLFSVRDNGIGFDRKYAERIFGIFKRLHGQEYPGTGIGLAICRRVVERHRGRIWAEPNPEGGSTFYFQLPTADAFPVSQRSA